MLVPDLFRRNGFEDFFEDPFRMPHPPVSAMKTDVRETENGYELAIDLPGVQKENVQAELHDGYLTVSATTTQNNDEKDASGKYIRRERYSGSFSRSYYVGEGMTEQDIRARFADGGLRLNIPKKETAAPAKKYISIEGR